MDPRITARAARVQEAVSRCSAAISPSAFLADSLCAEGLDLPPIKIVGTGVAGIATALPTSDRLRVLFLGTFVSHKGPQVLADALASLPEQVAVRVDALAVGPAPFPAWRAEVAARSGGRLRIGERVDPEAVTSLLAEHHVVVIPSLWAENAPLVALEARAAGRPVVASALGGLEELVVHGRDGLLFPAGDVERLAAILTELTDRSRLDALARTVTAPRTLAHWAESIDREWRRVLEEGA